MCPAQRCQTPRANQTSDHRQNQPDHQRCKGNPGGLRQRASRKARSAAQQHREIAANKAKGAARAKNGYDENGYQRQGPGQPRIQHSRTRAANPCRAGRDPASQEEGDDPGQDRPTIAKGSVRRRSPNRQRDSSTQRAKHRQGRHNRKKSAPDRPPADPIAPGTWPNPITRRCGVGSACLATRGYRGVGWPSLICRGGLLRGILST